MMLQEQYEMHSNALEIGSEEKVKKTLDGVSAKITEQSTRIAEQERTIAELRAKLEASSQTSEIDALKKQMEDLRNQFTRELTEVVTTLRFEHDTEKMVKERAEEIHADKVDKIKTGRKGKSAPIPKI
jgi:uncharacterized coiled-coil protein SlyX